MFWVTLIIAGIGVVFAKLGALSVWLQVFKTTTAFLLGSIFLAGLYTAWKAVSRRQQKNTVESQKIQHLK